MLFRLLLFLLVTHSNMLCAQQNDNWSISACLELNHFAKATPGYVSTDFHFNHKRSMFSIGYSFPMYTQEYEDNDDLTPLRMKIPTLNAYYTYNFIERTDASKLSIGTTIGYKFGHWKTQDSTFNYYYPATLGTTIQQISKVNIDKRRESDQHHFYVGLHGEYPWKKVRFMASLGVGITFRASYHFDVETTYYTQGNSTRQIFYKAITPFGYLSQSWYAKIGVMVPLNAFRKG